MATPSTQCDPMEFCEDPPGQPRCESELASSNPCAICLESLQSSNATCTLECGHMFHSRCLLTAFQHNNTRCPSCRANMLDEAKPSSYREQSVFAEIQSIITDNHHTYLQSQRELRNYNSRVNRFVNANIEIKKKKEHMNMLKKEYNEWTTYMQKEWSRVERAAWNSEHMQTLRADDIKKRRRLRYSINSYEETIKEKLGEQPCNRPMRALSLDILIGRGDDTVDQ